MRKPDEEILNFGRQMLPKEIVELWEDYGFGEYGDGLIKVVDPRAYMNSLYSWLGRKNLSRIPIIVTAFGDIFYYRKLANNENDVSLLNIHYRKIEACGASYQDFFERYILDKGYIKKVRLANSRLFVGETSSQASNTPSYSFVYEKPSSFRRFSGLYLPNSLLE